MAKFPINHIALVYSGDNCYVTIAALIVISQSSYSLLSWGLGHLRCLVIFIFDLAPNSLACSYVIVFLFKLHIFFVRIVHYYGSAGHCVRCNVCLLVFKEIKGYYRSINDGLEYVPCICSFNIFIMAEELNKVYL